MMFDAHERFAELAAGHALHALEPGEEQVFLVHLDSCADCRRAVDLHTETLGHLAYAAEPVELPSGILEGIRREIGQTGGEAAPPLSLDAVRRPHAWFANRSLVAAAAAAVLVVSLGVWNVSLQRDRSQSDKRVQQLAAAVSTLEQGAKQRAALTDPHGRPVAYALVRPDDTVSLVVDGLAPNDSGSSTYVLWQKGSYGVRAVGVFDVNGNGVDVINGLPLSRDVLGLEGFAVTREPGRRAPAAPGSTPVAVGGLST
jgi:anti-sigma-K factor RskA